MKEIQKKYAGDKERQSQEMMKLYRETGTNPLASCLPIILQAPIFFALFGVLLISGLNAPVGLPLQIPFMFLALLTGLMQALVFTLLSTVYILLSLPSPDEH